MVITVIYTTSQGPPSLFFKSPLLSHDAGLPRCYRGAIHWAQQGKQLRWNSFPIATALAENTTFRVLARNTSTKKRSHLACGQEPSDCLVASKGSIRQLSTSEDDDAGSSNIRLFGNPRPDTWWTGCRPEEAPGMQPDGRISSLPQLLLTGSNKQALQDYFDNTWILTEHLFAGLQREEAFFVPPVHGLRHPLIFYYGHVAVLYVNKLRAAGIIHKPVNAFLEALLETGVDEMSWDVMGSDDMKWPSVREVHAYRGEVYKLVNDVIAAAPDEVFQNIGMDSPYWALPMTIEHERIHIETSSILIRELPLEYVAQPAGWPEHHPCHRDTSHSTIENTLVHVEAGSVTLGKHEEFPSFGWDNEYGSRTFSVPAFEATKHMISNGEYMEFVKDMGYSRRELWTESGWKWKMFRNVKWPKFWVPQGPSGLHEYRLRTIFDEITMPLDWPVIVNFHEAKAFARRKTIREEQTMGGKGKAYRLTTELEHHMMRDNTSPLTRAYDPEVVDPVLSTRGHSATGGFANVNLVSGSETPVDKYPPNGRGFHDLFGNAWEWCEDQFSALDGFNVNPLYEDFSTPCFDGQHTIIMGGSFISTGNAASVFARFNFRPHFHQHAGFRLVAPLEREEAESFVTSCTDAPPPFVGTYPYRTSGKTATPADGERARRVAEEQSLAANIALHFATPPLANEDPIVAQGLRYPQRCAGIVLRALDGTHPAKDSVVLEVGCGAGGGSFELSKTVGMVIAVDASKSLLDVASAMAKDRKLAVECPSSRGSSVMQEVVLDSGVEPRRITFRQCNPMCFPSGLAELDAVVVHSVIDTVSSPKSLLARMGGGRGLVKRNGGIVVIVSPYDWNEETTPRGSWLGGYLDANGNEVSPAQGLSSGLGEDFKLINVEQVPRLRPLTDRRFEYALAEATVWRRD